MVTARYRTLKLCLNLNRPADRRLVEAIETARSGTMKISDLLREALAVYLEIRQAVGPTAVTATPAPAGAPSLDAPADDEGIDLFAIASYRAPDADSDRE